MILFLLVGYIYEVYGTRCSTLLHCTGLCSAMILIGLQMNSGNIPLFICSPVAHSSHEPMHHPSGWCIGSWVTHSVHLMSYPSNSWGVHSVHLMSYPSNSWGVHSVHP